MVVIRRKTQKLAGLCGMHNNKEKKKRRGSPQLQSMSFAKVMLVVGLVDVGMGDWCRSEARVVVMLLVKRVLFS